MIEFLGEVLAWFGEQGRWLGDGGVVVRVGEHLALAAVPMAISLVATIPVAVWLGHRRIGEFSTSAVVNLGRAVPSFGLLVLAGLFFLRAGVSLRFWPAVVALVALAIPPMFTNAYTSMVTIDAETVEAARGMGMTESEILWRVEVPVGAPLSPSLRCCHRGEGSVSTWFVGLLRERQDRSRCSQERSSSPD